MQQCKREKRGYHRDMHLNLIDILKAKKTDLTGFLDANATRKGDLSWLFLPDEVKNRVVMVAHIDTVYDDSIEKRIEVLNNGQELWSPDGLGADDRAGVWAGIEVFYCMPEPYRPVLLLTDEEESGCHGAIEASHLFKDMLSDVSFFLELDRRGDRQCVFYNNEPEEFKLYIESFGFRRAAGITSDIAHLCPAVNRCGVNLSIGNRKPHSKEETLVIAHLQNTAERLPLILQDNCKRQEQWPLTA